MSLNSFGSVNTKLRVLFSCKFMLLHKIVVALSWSPIPLVNSINVVIYELSFYWVQKGSRAGIRGPVVGSKRSPALVKFSNLDFGVSVVLEGFFKCSFGYINRIIWFFK